MANRTLRVLLKKIYTDGSIDTIYLKSRASDVFLDGSSIDTLDTIVTKVNGIQAGATAVSSSDTNGYISINGTATQVYAHPNSGVTPGTYGTVTVDNSGHIISGSNSDYLLSSSKVTFAEATEKANIVSNSDTIAVMLGKLAKWYSSFGSLAWLSSVGTSQLDTTLSTAYNQRVVTGTANTTASKAEVQSFVEGVKADIESSSWESLADKLDYPVVINSDKTANDKEEFISIMNDSKVSQAFLDELNGADLGNLFSNGQGIMVGDGCIWLRDVNFDGIDQVGTPEFKVVSFNGLTE